MLGGIVTLGGDECSSRSQILTLFLGVEIDWIVN